MTEVQPDTQFQPFQVVGKLMYGQAEEYDAVDDRMAISVALGGTPGLWVRPVLTLQPAGSLSVTMDKFAAALMVGDNTLAICAKWDPTQVNFPGGGTTEQQYEIWLSADVEGGQWRISVERAEDVFSGGQGHLLGISLGTVFVEAGANANNGTPGFRLWHALSSVGSIRNYRRPWERQWFETFNPYRAWGSLTGMDESQTLDILWNNQWYTIFNGQERGQLTNGPFFTQSGWFGPGGGSDLSPDGWTNSNGDFFIRWTLPYTDNEVFLQITSTHHGGGFIPVIMAVDASGAWVRCYSGGGQLKPNTQVGCHWLARGIRVTGPASV